MAKQAEEALKKAEEDQIAEALSKGGIIAQRSLENEKKLASLIKLKQSLMKGKAKPGKPLFNLDRWS